MHADVDALNYPYIRIRSVDWLKRTLLVFPHVVRMVPEWGGPTDDPEVRRFCSLEGRRGPLLRNARLYSHNVYNAQLNLIRRIEQALSDNGVEFTHRFGKDAVYGARGSDSARPLWDDRLRDQTFQLHESKMTSELSDMLRNAGLAWNPPRAHSGGYVEMSPELGNAVMATLAFACAEDEGLTLVTEFPELFGRLIHQPKDRIFEACLGNESEPTQGEPTQVPKTNLAEFVVYQRCDPRKLTPERIQALNKEWEALAAFKDALDSAAQSLPKIMLDQDRRKERLNDLINDIFKKWRRDRLNLSSYARELFGYDALDQPEKLLEKVAEFRSRSDCCGGIRKCCNECGSWFRDWRSVPCGKVVSEAEESGK